MRFHFRDEGLVPMIEHMEKRPRLLPYGEGETKKKGLWLVKDDGVYLMAPSEERYGKVIYATGFPSGSHLGGDDFAEFISLPDDHISLIKRMESEINITLDDTSIRIETRKA